MQLYKIIVYLGNILFVSYFGADCTCTLPAQLSGSWWDSGVKKRITFSSLQITSGWELTLISAEFSTYTCIRSDSSRWVFRSDQTVAYLFGLNYYAVFCLKFSNLTDNSYLYYLKSNPEESLENRRVLLVDVSTYEEYISIDEFCNSTNGPDYREYNVLVKENMQNSIHVEDFPDPLLGMFYYTVDDGSTTNCGAGSVWDGCFVDDMIDRTTVKVNYTQCSTTLFGSTTGVLYHVASVYNDTTYYTTLINSDGTDTIFTCIAVTQTDNERSVSTNPGGCAAGQVSKIRTSDSSSLLLTLTAYETCLVTTTTSTTTPAATTTPTTVTTSNNNTGNTDGSTSSESNSNSTVIVGVVLSLLLLIAIIIIAYLIYQNYLKPTKKQITHRSSTGDSALDIKKPLPADSDFTHSGTDRRSTGDSARDIKKPLPADSDFTRSDHPKSKDRFVENDIVVEPMTPRENVDNPFDEPFNGNLSPIPEQQRPPSSYMLTKDHVQTDRIGKGLRGNLGSLSDGTQPPVRPHWHKEKTLPPIPGYS